MLKVLFIEDNQIFRDAFKERLLRRFPTLMMEEAVNGEEALLKIENDPPDLIITDMHLSGMNGFHLTQKVKKGFPGISVVIITGYDLPEYREAALQYGANGFWRKESVEWEDIETFFESIVKGAGHPFDHKGD